MKLSSFGRFALSSAVALSLANSPLLAESLADAVGSLGSSAAAQDTQGFGHDGGGDHGPGGDRGGDRGPSGPGGGRGPGGWGPGGGRGPGWGPGGGRGPGNPGTGPGVTPIVTDCDCVFYSDVNATGYELELREAGGAEVIGNYQFSESCESARTTVQACHAR